MKIIKGGKFKEDINIERSHMLLEKEKKFIFIIVDFLDGNTILMSYPRALFCNIYELEENFFEKENDFEIRYNALDKIITYWKKGMGGFLHTFDDFRCGEVASFYPWHSIKRINISLTIPGGLFADEEEIEDFISQAPEKTIFTVNLIQE